LYLLSLKLTAVRKKLYLACSLIFLLSLSCRVNYTGKIMTVAGPIEPASMGLTLTHEHILVDFIGADSITYDRWNRDEVREKASPFLNEAKKLGAVTLVECTPAYLGRDPELMKSISENTGLNILTNTGYYGASRDRYIPAHAYKETADELASRWIKEWKKGIEGTGVRPGFIKIGVMSGDLSELHRKLVRAAAKTHLATGLVIASHTGPATPAFAELGVLLEEGVSPEAFIWVHAQSEKDASAHVMAARTGAWISFDGLNEENVPDYVEMIKNMKDNGLLNKVLLSHDAGWYKPGMPGGGDYRGYTALFLKLIPALRDEGFSGDEIDQLVIRNPARAFTIEVRGSE
jgi:phosphotriesterase-related protein